MVKEENHEAMLTEKVFEAARAKCASPVATPARANTLKYGDPVGQELPTVAAHSALAQGSKACSFISEMVFSGGGDSPLKCLLASSGMGACMPRA